jgi:ABC-type phosphate/phosphonate transport system substrate-binding protein
MEMIACARMYASAPSLSAAWRRLLAWVAARSGVAMEIIEHAHPALLDDLWAREDMGCVFMCGYPWVLRQRRPRLLAAPVPSPARYGDRPIYFTDFLVRADSPYRSLEDTFGTRLAYSAEESHSGYNAARHHLLAYRTPARPTLYARTIGPLISQRIVLDAVIDGRADVAPVDSYLLDLWRRHLPEVADRVRVVATTEPAPIPPLVASPGIDDATCERVIGALTAAHRAPEIADTLGAVLISRFEPVTAEAFDVFLERRRVAERAGYPVLA